MSIFATLKLVFILSIKKYRKDNLTQWNSFIKNSLNGTFLLDRGFMDYHSDRFTDHSLTIFDEEVLICCVPAHGVDRKWLSHRGLTYGGLIFKEQKTYKEMGNILNAITNYLKSNNFNSCEFNLSPPIYDDNHDEVLETLIRNGFEVTRSFDNMHVLLEDRSTVSSKKTAGYRNGTFSELVFETSCDISIFYNEVLVPSLLSRHAAVPVHSLDELKKLQENFCDKISVQAVYLNDKMISGVLFFIKDNIVKSQYAASTLKGFQLRAMDFLYIESMEYFNIAGKKIMDYGTANNPDGSIISGLKRFKKELGAVTAPMLRLSKSL